MGRENVPDELTDQAKESSRQELWKEHLVTSYCLFTVKCEAVLSLRSLCGPVECSSPGSSVHGIFQARNTGGGCIPTPGDLPDPGIEPVSLALPALAGGFFTPSATWWRRQWHPTPVLLPGESHGRRSLVGCSPWGLEESDTTERLHFHFSLSCIGEGNGNPLQCSCLENPRDGGAWWAAVYGVAQSRTRLK